MISKKLKVVSTMLLVFIYSTVLCLGSFSYALTSDTRNASITSGFYYIKNANNNLYVSDLDYFSMILGSFVDHKQQRWEISSASNGYYRIQNVYTKKYLTAPADYSEGSLIEQANLSTNATIQDRQLWAFTQIGTQFRIQAKSHESSGLYLASSASINVYGYALIQTSNLTENREKWILEPTTTAYLFGLDYNQEGHNHKTALTTTNTNLLTEGYNSNLIINQTITKSTMLNYLQNSNILMIRSHGGYNDFDTYMIMLPGGGINDNYQICAFDIYDLSTDTGIDMSDCDVAAFIGCHTGRDTILNLPQAAVLAGADTAIGFLDEIQCNEAESWTTYFSNYYLYGYSAENAATSAANLFGRESNFVELIVIETN